MVSMVLSKAERREAKLMRTSAWGCFFMASAMFLYTVKIENNVFLDAKFTLWGFLQVKTLFCSLQKSSHVSKTWIFHETACTSYTLPTGVCTKKNFFYFTIFLINPLYSYLEQGFLYAPSKTFAYDLLWKKKEVLIYMFYEYIQNKGNTCTIISKV